MLPGLSLPVSIFEPLNRDGALGARRIVLIGYLGSGASDHPAVFDYRLASHAGCVAALLAYPGIESADVLGYSMGGTVAIRLALDHPGCVGNLAAAEGNLMPGGGEGSRTIVCTPRDEFVATSLAAILEVLRAEGLGALADGWATTDPNGIWGNADALVRLDRGFMGAFLSLSLPRSCIFGEKSLARGPAPDVSDSAVLAAEGVGTAVVPGAGHLMLLDSPEGFAGEVAEVFRQERGQGA